MAAAEMFTSCHYCELPASSKHLALKVRRGLGRRKATYVYACCVHEAQAKREAGYSRALRIGA